MALASFAAYLFHRPVFAILAEMAQKLDMGSWLQSVFMIGIGSPLLFIISYFIQIGDKKTRALFSRAKRR